MTRAVDLAAIAVRLLAVLTLALLACLLAGLYGALHNQLSVTVSPEYFTRFKFPQFGIDPSVPLRVGAAVIGFRAAWWMGVPVGSLLGALGCFTRNVRELFAETLKAYGVALGTTAVVGLVGLLCAVGATTFGRVAAPTEWTTAMGVHDVPAFFRAGCLHNASYLGGIVGLAVAAAWRVRRAGQRLRAGLGASTRTGT